MSRALRSGTADAFHALMGSFRGLIYYPTLAGHEDMKVLYEEVTRRFPEVIQDGNEDQPYNVMNALVDWLAALSPAELNQELNQRVVAITKWCEDLPRGETAADDPYTVLVVGFYEGLFNTETTRCLIPH